MFLEHIKNPQKIADNMKNVADIVFPFQKEDDFNLENDLSYLKKQIVHLDGYEVCLYYSRCFSNQKDIYLKVLQIYSQDTAFLPFRISCRAAKLFFDNDVPILVKKINYSLDLNTIRESIIWSIYIDKNNEIIHLNKVEDGCIMEKSEYEGFPFYTIKKQTEKENGSD